MEKKALSVRSTFVKDRMLFLLSAVVPRLERLHRGSLNGAFGALKSHTRVAEERSRTWHEIVSSLPVDLLADIRYLEKINIKNLNFEMEGKESGSRAGQGRGIPTQRKPKWRTIKTNADLVQVCREILQGVLIIVAKVRLAHSPVQREIVLDSVIFEEVCEHEEVGFAARALLRIAINEWVVAILVPNIRSAGLSKASEG